MRGRLLAEWAEKYERIEDEIKRCEKKLETLERVEKNLVMDIWIDSINLAISFPFFCALASMIDDIAGIFLYFYVPVLALLAIFTLGRNIIGLFKSISLRRYHKRTDLPFQYPRPILVNSNYPTNYPPNYYAERLCNEWLIAKYHSEMGQLKKLRREIEQASEQDYNNLQESLNEIKIYEMIGRAR